MLDRPRSPLASSFFLAFVLVGSASCGRPRSATSLLQQDLRILPAETRVLMHGAIAAERAAPEWATAVEILRADPAVAEGLQMLTENCGIDPFARIDSITVGFSGIGWLPVLASSAEFAAIVRGTFEQAKLLACLQGEGAPTPASVNHQGVAIYGGNARPHIALLGTGLLVIGTNSFIRKTIDLYRAGRGGGAVDANPALRALVARAGSATAVWAAAALVAADRDLLRSSDVLKWAADVREIFGELSLDGGWRSILHLDLKDQNRTQSLETNAKKFLASVTRAPTGVIEMLLGSTQAIRNGTTVRLQTTLATNRVRQMLTFVTGQDGCYNGYLQAVRSASPPGAEDAEDSQAGGKRFKVPIELRVVRGNAGNQEAALSFRSGTGAPVTCRYRGGSNQRHPTSTEQIQNGLKYLLTSCTGGITAGTVVVADWIKLSVAGADAEAGQALVQAHLVCL